MTIAPTWAYRAAIVAAVVVAYSNGLSGAFVFDDIKSVRDNLGIRDLGETVRSLPRVLRPVTELTLALNYAADGLRTWGYHAFNVAAHAAAALVLFALIRGTLRLPALRAWAEPDADRLAFAAALVWAVHPLNTQAVAYVIQRAQVLAGLFEFLTLYALLREATTAGRRWPWYAAAVAACAAAMGSKQDAVVTPVLALLFDRVFLSPTWGGVARRWAVHLPLFATSFLLTFSILYAIQGNAAIGPAATGHTVTAGFASDGLTPWRYALTESEVILHYLRLAALPYPLCADYNDWPVANAFGDVAPAVVAVWLLLAATAMCLWRVPPVGFLMAAFFLALAPTSSVMPIDDVAFEHRTYTPLAAVVTLAATGLLALTRRFMGNPRLTFSVIAVVVAVGCAAMTFARCGDYASVESVWRATVATRPGNRRAQHNLAIQLASEHRTEEAIAHFLESARLQPSPGTSAFLAQLLLESHRPDEAQEYLEKALVEPWSKEDKALFEGEISPYKLHFNLGNLLCEGGDFEGALKQYRLAADAYPDGADVYINTGRPLIALGRWADAADALRTAVRVNPQSSLAHNNFGLVLRRLGEPASAVNEFRQAVEIAPDAVMAYNNWGATLVRVGKAEEAVAVFRRGLARSPVLPQTLYGLAHALDRSGHGLQAEAAYRRARLVAPGLPAAYTVTAWELSTNPKPELRDPPEAVRLAEIAARATGERQVDPLDALAAALAADGQFEAAVAVAKRAEQLPGLPPPRRAAIRNRIDQYQQQRAFVQTPPPAAPVHVLPQSSKPGD